MPGTYDAETNLAFWGTGNGGPWMGDQRPGDNLYTSSVVALDGKTGAIKGHFQYHQNDSWDWDEVSPPILVPYKFEGRDVKGLVDVARDGFLWRLERTDGKINFVAGQPFVAHNVFKGVEPKTGRPIVDLDHKPGTDKTATFCPSLWGGKDWPPVAYSPKTKLLYIPANENLCTQLRGEKVKYVAGERYIGVASNTMLMVAGADHIGELQAWDLDAGKKVWTTKLPSQNWGPVLATGGDVLFSGGTNDRMFRAFDAKTGADPLAIPDAVGRERRAGLLRDRRQAVHRRAVRLGRRRAAHAGPAQPALPRQVFAGAARRRGLRVRVEVIRGGRMCGP